MSTGATSGLGSGLDGQAMLKLLITELQYQNPMEPMSNTEMITQTSQLAMVSGMNELKQSFGEVLEFYRLTGSAELIGKEVAYQDGDAVQRGLVESVEFQGDAVRAIVGGYRVPVENIIEIS